ncbi:quinoprotein relay system zinc metallohydrolase 1 [Marinobacterium arenosum]|uniref:quinoprotein relay system zinc metallohydrolase 1 n=1 Tax=Marinobacterium arenosum TaxID=2862496 RepID=UPI001C983D49|nr:quinoprotein relay system zinc metallohydrolase 1 [Marinobacterium arenosum]MBY4675853.1 quinoprotein relay system zinc metallohydrolase 1 [Marinobacterium arenosum]
MLHSHFSRIFKAFALLILMLPGQSWAAPLSYDLKPQLIAEDTYLLQGRLEDFSRGNGGNIVNTAFIVTRDGVVVFDTGPSFRYGKAMRQAIAQVTDQPVLHVFNSHHHPDHFLGNQAFADGTIWALPDTGRLMAEQGGAFSDNMYRLVGDWMRATEMQLPNRPLQVDRLQVGEHRLRFFPMTGHTGADLVMLDETTGVLFAGDMVFYQRALTTPQTPGLAVWLRDLDAIAAIPHRLLVPGHGPAVPDGSAIGQMGDYLRWLDLTLRSAAERGMSMTELMKIPFDARFAEVALRRHEFIRTVAHLYPRYEEAVFQKQ